MEQRAVADYVAEVLAEFAQSERARCVVPGHLNSLDYFFEMLSALNEADDRTSFFIRAHIGNFSLFFSGVFPDRIRFRAEIRGFPNVNITSPSGERTLAQRAIIVSRKNMKWRKFTARSRSGSRRLGGL